jgi:hypothetical protein
MRMPGCAHAGVADVEGTARHGRKGQRALDQGEHLAGQAHRLLGGQAVDARELGVALVGAHRAVDAVHLGHHGVDRGVAARFVVGPQLDRDGGAHDRLVAVEPPAHRCRPRRQRALRRLRPPGAARSERGDGVHLSAPWRARRSTNSTPCAIPHADRTNSGSIQRAHLRCAPHAATVH